MNPNFDKQDYKALKAEAKEAGVYTTSKDLTNYDLKYNGVSIAYEPCGSSEDTRMLAVSVAYCAPEDKFRNKVGKYQALKKLVEGEYVQLPLAQYLLTNGKDMTSSFLLELFTV